MLTRMVSIRSPLMVHHSRNGSNLSMESTGSVLEQHEEFAKWWEQWMRRVRQNRTNASKLIDSWRAEPRGACRRWLIRLVNAIAACRCVLSTVFLVIRSAFNL
jgi:hypothetical protein